MQLPRSRSATLEQPLKLHHRSGMVGLADDGKCVEQEIQ
jgi:hypothetical protein